MKARRYDGVLVLNHAIERPERWWESLRLETIPLMRKAAGVVERRDRLHPSAPKSETLLARHRGIRPNGVLSAAGS